MDLSSTYKWIPGLNNSEPISINDKESNPSPRNPIRRTDQKSLDQSNTEVNKDSQQQKQLELTNPSSNIKHENNVNPLDLSLFWGYNNTTNHDDAVNDGTIDDKIKSKQIEVVQAVIAVSAGSDIIPDEEFKSVTLTEDVVKIVKPHETKEPKPLFDRILSMILPESAAVILGYDVWDIG